MFVRTKTVKTAKGTQEYYQLVETIKERNIPRQRVIYTLGKVEDFDRRKVDELICALEEYTGEIHILKSLNDVNHIWSKNEGDVFAFEEMWEELDLDSYFYQAIYDNDEFDFTTIVALKILIFHQILTRNRIPILEWMENHVFLSSGEEVNRENISQAYRFLSLFLDKLQEDLSQLYSNHFTFDTRIIHGGFFALDYPQMNRSFTASSLHFPVFLVLSREGLPIFCDLLPYSKAPTGKDFLSPMEGLKDRFSPQNIFFIDQNGVLSKEDGQEVLHSGCDYMTYVPRWKWRAISQKAETTRGRFSRVDADLHIKEFTWNNERYIQCFIPSQKDLEREFRNSFLRDLKEDITGLDAMRRKAYELQEDTLKGPFIRQVKDGLRINKSTHMEEERFEGSTILSISNQELEPEELSRSFSHFLQIEESFNPLQYYPQLEPGFQYAEERVKAHLGLQLFSHIMERFFERKLSLAALRYDCYEGLRRLDWMKVSRIKVGDLDLLVRVESNPEAKEVLEALKYRQPFRLEEIEPEEDWGDELWDDEEFLEGEEDLE